jgi:glycosyltransferase involved in cell wall biosynthesis
MHPGATLTFVFQQAELECRLKASIATDPALRQAITLRGHVPNDQLADLFAAADLFVLGSHHEGSGYAVLEAMACGVPPVVSDIPSFRWLTDSGSIGALWKAGDADSFCAALERAFTRLGDAQRDACRRRFADFFSWEAIGRRAMAIYEDFSRT